jgi:hypothetical protein
MLGLCFLLQSHVGTSADQHSVCSAREREAGKEDRHCNGYTYLGLSLSFANLLGVCKFYPHS